MTEQINEGNAHSKRFRVFLLILAALFTYGVLSGLRASTSILVSSISNWTGMSYGTVSIAFSVMNVVLALSGPFFGFLTLKIHPSRIMIAGAIMGGIGFIGAAFSSSLPALIIFIGVFFGLGASALCYSIVYAAAVPIIGVKYSIIFGGLLSASQGALSMIFVPIFDIGSSVFGVQSCLIGIGILSLVTIPLCILFFPKKTGNDKSTKEMPRNQKHESLKKVLTSSISLPIFVILALGMFTYGVCDGGMINHLYEFTQMYQIPATISAFMVSIYSCFCMIGGILGGIICSRFKNRKLVLSISFIIWALLNFIGYFLEPSYVLAFILYPLCGLTMGMAIPTVSSITQKYVSINNFAVIFSLLYFFILLAYSLDSLFGGILFDITGNFFIVDMIAIGLAVLVFIVFGISGLKDRKHDATQK